jgi:hypothetical protein
VGKLSFSGFGGETLDFFVRGHPLSGFLPLWALASSAAFSKLWFGLVLGGKKGSRMVYSYCGGSLCLNLFGFARL